MKFGLHLVARRARKSRHRRRQLRSILEAELLDDVVQAIAGAAMWTWEEKGKGTKTILPATLPHT